MKLQKIILVASIFLLAAGCNSRNLVDNKSPLFQKVDELKVITVGEETLHVEVMDDDAERTQGLSGILSLPHSQGMLFDFTNTNINKPSFWMKDMKFDIDIIWIKDNEVVGVTKNLQAPVSNNYLPTYQAPREIDYVLEVNAGWVDQYSINKGTKVQL